MFSMPEPILAITPGQIIGLIIFTVSVLSWFVNLVQGNQQNQAPRPKNRPRDPVQSELEKFLQEVVGAKKQPEKKRPTPPVPQQKQPRAANDKKGGKTKSQQPRPAAAATATQRPGERAAATHLQTSAMGQGVRSHVHEHMEPNRIGAAVEQDIDSAVRNDLRPDATSDALHRAGNIHPLAKALRDPQGVRQAILLNEILSRPRSLRRT
ncbi:MAG: hypothetical protein H7062_12325 [Candidatus Saccharimonas sp.]|nr:hypothetical protein [Planctomycetaceae bacterium]